MSIFGIYFLCFFSLNGFASELSGYFKVDQNTFIFETTEGTSYSLKAMTENLFTSIKTLENRGALVSIPFSSLASDNTVTISQAPTIIKGDIEKKGMLEARLGDGDFYLDGELVKFREGKLIDGTQFDEISRQHFVGKNVQTRGRVINGLYIIESIVETDIFSATSAKNIIGSDEAVRIHSAFLDDQANYILKILPQYQLSSSLHSFRGNVFDNGRPVKPHDPVMIFTMSGHQGDDPISANGHLAVGLGEVQEDFTIRGEIYNVYIPPKNRKEIVSGNNNWIDYFGHVISGQNNYRPTYTLMIYGIDPKKMLRVRESLERYHAHFRVTDKQFSVAVNCGTLTVKALAREGIYGVERNGKNGSDKFPVLPSDFIRPEKMSASKQIAYVIKTPLSEYMPRNIWNAFFLNLDYLNTKENFGASRVDFIFYGQTPSRRLRGGIGTDSLADEMKAMIFGKRSLPSIN